MGIRLFLDDSRRPPDDFVLVKSVEEFTTVLEEYDADVVCLDFHLGYGEPTGLDAAQWMITHSRWPHEIYLHSSDPHARQRMFELLEAHAPRGTQIYRGPYRS